MVIQEEYTVYCCQRQLCCTCTAPGYYMVNNADILGTGELLCVSELLHIYLPRTPLTFFSCLCVSLCEWCLCSVCVMLLLSVLCLSICMFFFFSAKHHWTVYIRNPLLGLWSPNFLLPLWGSNLNIIGLNVTHIIVTLFDHRGSDFISFVIVGLSLHLVSFLC